MSDELRQEIDLLKAEITALKDERLPKVDRASKRRDRRQVLGGFGMFIIALTLAGTLSASALAGSNTVTSDDIVDNGIYHTDIRDSNVLSADVKNNSLTGADIDESTLVLPGGEGGLARIGSLDPPDESYADPVPPGAEDEVFATANFTVATSGFVAFMNTARYDRENRGTCSAGDPDNILGTIKIDDGSQSFEIGQSQTMWVNAGNHIIEYVLHPPVCHGTIGSGTSSFKDMHTRIYAYP